MQGKVLIIDDTKNIRLMITKALTSKGYEITSADNGNEGIYQFKNNKYDLVFLDIRMPGMSGTEVLKLLKEIDENATVIIITAFPTVKNAVDCIKLGAVDYLRKPFTAEKLSQIAEQVIVRKSLTSVNTNSYDSSIEYAKKCINQRNFDEAISYLKKAISISIDDSEPFKIMGNVYELKGNTEAAIKYYKVGLQVEPHNKEIMENLNRMKDKM